MDIGKQQRVIQVEPEPLRAPAEEPAEREPASVPAPPRKREREKVPAR